MATTFNKTWAKAKKWQYFVIQKAKLYKIGDANMTFYAWKQFNKGAQSVVADQVECAGADFDLFIDDGGDDTWTLDDLINYFPLGNGDNSPTPLGKQWLQLSQLPESYRYRRGLFNTNPNEFVV
eukprot:252246_1